MLAFIAKIYQQLGYKPGDRYPMLMNIAAVFAVNIGGAMTPISHSLAILGMGIYEGVTGEAIGLFTYLIYGVPTGTIAMLHGDQYSKPSMIIRYGLVAVIVCVLAGSLVGYNICTML